MNLDAFANPINVLEKEEGSLLISRAEFVPLSIIRTVL